LPEEEKGRGAKLATAGGLVVGEVKSSRNRRILRGENFEKNFF